jgi:hypothetical protein
MRRAAVGQEKDAVGNESPVFEPARQHDDEAKASSSPPFDRIGASRRLLSYYVHSNEPSAEKLCRHLIAFRLALRAWPSPFGSARLPTLRLYVSHNDHQLPIYDLHHLPTTTLNRNHARRVHFLYDEPPVLLFPLLRNLLPPDPKLQTPLSVLYFETQGQALRADA